MEAICCCAFQSLEMNNQAHIVQKMEGWGGKITKADDINMWNGSESWSNIKLNIKQAALGKTFLRLFFFGLSYASGVHCTVLRLLEYANTV